MSNVMSRHHRTVRTPEQGYGRFGASGQLIGMGSYPLQSPKSHGINFVSAIRIRFVRVSLYL